MEISTQKQSVNLQNHHEQEEEEEDINASFTCEICMEPVSENKQFKNKNLCAHPFCTDCIARYIQFEIEDHTANIKCPGSNCQQALDPLSCRDIIPTSVFSKWCDVLCDGYVLGFERSYCPNRDCMELVVDECGGNVKKSRCPYCKQFFCFQCKSAWHAGYRCEESRNMRDPNDILFGQLAERKAWIRCPGCGHCVERRNGCHLVKCRCKTRFCYRCGKELSNASSLKCKCRERIDCGCNFWEAACYIVVLLFIFIMYILSLAKSS